MSVRNNSKTQYNKVNTTSTETPYELARSGIFYYLKYVNYYNEIYKSGSNLTSKPTVVFYTENSQNKVVIDYTLANKTDKKYISSFFANLTENTTFNLTNASYLDKAENEANLGCTLGFVSYKGDKIFAVVNNVTNKNSKIETYFGDYFLSTPQLNKSGVLNQNDTTKSMALVSINPQTDKTLNSLGIAPGDRIEVVKQGATNNQIRYEVLEAGTINDQEIIYVKGTPTPESYIGYPAILNVYIKGVSTISKALDGELGCCYNTTNTIPNNTEYQCSLRGMNFSRGTSCELSDSGIIIPDAIPSDKKIKYTTGTITVDGIFEVSFNNSLMNLKLNYGNTSLLDNKNKIIYLRFKKAYAFVQNDFSNYQNALRISSTKDFYSPYTTDVFGTVPYDGVGAVQYIYTSETTPANLYLFSEKYKNILSQYKIVILQ